MMAALLAAFLSAQAADTTSTLHLLQRPGFHEVGVLVPRSPGGITAVKIGATSGILYTTWRWRRTHPRAARVVLLIGTASATAATIHNLRVGARK